jgi:hypothetical protein
MTDLYLGAADELPEFQHQMIQASGAVQNLTGTTVKFMLQKVDRYNGTRTDVVAAGDATIVDAATGVANYALTSGQAALLVPGYYEVRWRVVFGTRPMSFPNDRWLTLQVT